MSTRRVAGSRPAEHDRPPVSGRTRITVGYAPTVAAHTAVFWAAERAARSGAELRVVWCNDGRTEADAQVVGNDLTALVEGDVTPLQAMAEAVRRVHPAMPISTEVLEGSPRDVFAAHGREPDLLVVGRSRHGGPSRFWRGTTTQWLSRHTECPVIMVPEHTAPALPVRVVVGTDGSDTAMAAVDWAAREADRTGVELMVVQAWQAPYRAVDPASEQAHDIDEVAAALSLEHAVEAARDVCGGVITSRLVERTAAASLLDAAMPGDLLVVGASGHGAVSSALLGSTVNRLLDEATVPVAVVGRRHDAR